MRKHPASIQVSKIEHFDIGGNIKLAYRLFAAKHAETGRFYLGGYKGDMNSMKSTGVELEAQMRDRSSCLRFDFQGQGLSNGSISLSSWLRDSITMLDSVCGKEKQVLVGSSIGAWLALHIALQRPHRVKSMVLIAPAIDITGYWWAKLSEAEQQTALAERRVHLKTQYQGSDEYLPLHFYQDGEQLQLLNGQAESIDITCPIRILHGMRDTIVPYSCSTKLLSCLKSADVHLTLIKDGDHQLSRPQDLSSMLAAVQEMEDY